MNELHKRYVGDIFSFNMSRRSDFNIKHCIFNNVVYNNTANVCTGITTEFRYYYLLVDGMLKIILRSCEVFRIFISRNRIQSLYGYIGPWLLECCARF